MAGVRLASCCVPNCKDQTSKRHRFPKSNVHIFKIWLRNVGRSNFFDLDTETIYKRYFVCDRHFSEEFKVPGTKRGLKKTAIPTLYMPVCEDSTQPPASPLQKSLPQDSPLPQACPLSKASSPPLVQISRLPETSPVPQASSLPTTKMKIRSKNTKNQGEDEDLMKLSKEELIQRIKCLEAHNLQLKNIIAKADKKIERQRTQKPFDYSKVMFRHVLLKFFYLGWEYQGFVTQEDTINTIEHHLFQALERTCLIKDRASSNYNRCGRTDKGVSSFGQVISIDVRSKLAKTKQDNLDDEIDYCAVLNKVLPDNIQCVAWASVTSDFSARFNCNSRTYKYFFPKGQLDIAAMEDASQLLLGTHDYRNFCKMDVGNGVTNFVRNIQSISIDSIDCDECVEEKNAYMMYVITIKGQAFLWHQIRCIMAVLFLIGQGKEKPDIIPQLLDVTANPRKPEYNMASEVPLNLFFCDYENVKWVGSEDSVKGVMKKLRNMWMFLAIKEKMLKTMLETIEDLSGIENSPCLSDNLMPGAKAKSHIPLMKRQKCDSLEDKINYYAKRRKIEITPENIHIDL